MSTGKTFPRLYAEDCLQWSQNLFHKFSFSSLLTFGCIVLNQQPVHLQAYPLVHIYYVGEVLILLELH